MVCGSEWCCILGESVYEFQTLIGAGIALFTAFIIYLSAKLPIDAAEKEMKVKENQKRNYTAMILAQYSKRIEYEVGKANRSLSGMDGITMSSFDKEGAKLTVDDIIFNVELMMLLPNRILTKVMKIKSYIDAHNLDMSKHTNNYDVVQSAIEKDRLDQIRKQAKVLLDEIYVK